MFSNIDFHSPMLIWLQSLLSVQSVQVKNQSEVAQLYPTLCYPMDCSLPDSSIRGIFQATILEWVAISFSKADSKTKSPIWHQSGLISQVHGGRLITLDYFHHKMGSVLLLLE